MTQQQPYQSPFIEFITLLLTVMAVSCREKTHLKNLHSHSSGHYINFSHYIILQRSISRNSIMYRNAVYEFPAADCSQVITNNFVLSNIDHTSLIHSLLKYLIHVQKNKKGILLPTPIPELDHLQTSAVPRYSAHEWNTTGKGSKAPD